MSSFQTGAVSVPFVSDLTQARQQWQQFMNEVQSHRVNIPATFGNVQGPPAAGGFQGPGSYDPTAGSAYRFTGNNIAAGRGGGGPREYERRLEALEARELQLRERMLAALEAQAGRAESRAARDPGDDEGGGGGGAGGGGRGIGGRLLGRYLAPAFIFREGLKVATDIAEHADQLALARTPVEALQSEREYQKKLESVPLFGQGIGLYRRLTGDQLKDDRAFQAAEESVKDVGAAQGRFREGLTAQAGVGALRARVEGLGIPSEFGRQKRTLQDEYYDWREAQVAQLKGESAATDGPDVTPEERRRRILAYNTHVDQFREQDPARADLARAGYANLVRDLNRKVSDLGFDEPGLHARLEGRPGIARERDFEQGLQRRETEANRYSGVYGRSVRRQNAERRAVEQEDIDEGVRARDAGTESIYDQIHRSPAQSARDRLAEQRRVALRGARDPRDALSINSEFDARGRLTEQERSDENFGLVSSLRARNYSEGIRARTTGPPALNAEEANVADILTGTLRQAERALTAGRGALVPDIYQGGRLQLEAFRQDFKQGFKADEVDLQRTALSGPGTEDPGKVFDSLDDALKKLTEVPKTLDQIRDLLRGFLKAAP